MASSTTTTTAPLDAAAAAASPSPSPVERPLAEEIVATTRAVHARINKLITARLPLALPPRAADPGAYISGMMHFVPVYMTFEKLWQDILDTPPTEEEDGDRDDSNEQEQGEGCHPQVCERVHSVLRTVYLPGLVRSHRLRADIQAITGWSDAVLDEQLDAVVGEAGRLRDFVGHIRRAVRTKPHVLIAYSYILFMALFAGGRFIRASFEAAGDDFWGAVPAPIRPTLRPCEEIDKDDKDDVSRAAAAAAAAAASSSPHAMIPLRFWNFESAQDGEELKREYKEKLLDWQDRLTAQERQDIVQESTLIFESIGSIVTQLDDVGQAEEQPDKKEGSLRLLRQSLSGLLKYPLGGGARPRDSVLVTKERSARLPKTSPSSGAAATTPTSDAPPRSMRFDKPLPVPLRTKDNNNNHHDGGHSSSSLKVTPRELRGVSVAAWAFVAAVGLVLVGAGFTRRLSLEGLVV